jgi:hypothetical protein
LVVLQVVVIVMSLGFILFVTVLHIIGKVRNLRVVWTQQGSSWRCRHREDGFCCCGSPAVCCAPSLSRSTCSASIWVGANQMFVEPDEKGGA